MNRRFAILKTFPVALQLLTILRLPSKIEIKAKTVAESMAWFPLVGLLIGFILGGIWYIMSFVFPPLLVSLLVVMTVAIITRGLHLDGLSDTLDGLGGGYTKERRLEIMKDSHIGAFGVTGIIFAILLKMMAIFELSETSRLLVLIIFPMMSRFSMVLVAWKCPYARKEGGLGKDYVESVNSSAVILAATTTLVVSLLLVSYWGLILFLSVIFISLILAWFFLRALGGVTGDVLGAVNELTEISVLVLCLALPIN